MHSSVVPDSIYGYIVQHVAAGDPGHYLLLNSIILQLPGLGWAGLAGLGLISKKTPTSSLMTAEQAPLLLLLIILLKRNTNRKLWLIGAEAATAAAAAVAGVVRWYQGVVEPCCCCCKTAQGSPLSYFLLQLFVTLYTFLIIFTFAL